MSPRPGSTYPVHVDQHHECISLARGVLFSFEVAVDQLWSVRDQTVKVPVQTTTALVEPNRHMSSYTALHSPVDGVNGQHSISADVGVSVLKAGPDGRHQRLKKLGLLQLTKKTKC